MKYCSQCGSATYVAIPQGDNRHRHICSQSDCNTIHYQNPRIITGTVPVHENQVLLCKRAIEPRYGLWTLPAGFLENGETTEQGAIRESWEEARTDLVVEQLYTIFDLPHINQVYFFYKARLNTLSFSASEESLEVRLFRKEDIPWDSLAFPVITATLKHYFSDLQQQHFPFRTEVIDRRT